MSLASIAQQYRTRAEIPDPEDTQELDPVELEPEPEPEQEQEAVAPKKRSKAKAPDEE